MTSIFYIPLSLISSVICMHICGQTQARMCLEVRGQLEGGIPSLLLPHVSGNQIPAIGLGSRHFCQLGCLSWKKTTFGKLGRSKGSRANRPVAAGCALCLWALVAQVYTFHPPSTTPSLSPFWAGTQGIEQQGQDSTIALHPYPMICFFICKWIFTSSSCGDQRRGSRDKIDSDRRSVSSLSTLNS